MIARLLEVLSETEMTVVSKYVPPFPSVTLFRTEFDGSRDCQSARGYLDQYRVSLARTIPVGRKPV